jgi:predicted SAM-dependent methyltransferase
MTSSLSSLPEEVKRPLRPIRTLGRRLRLRWNTAVRAPDGAPTLDLSDGALRRVLVTLGLRRPISGPRRVEVGSGWTPQGGYVHVDVDPEAPDIDLTPRGTRLPIPDAWATHLLSIHMIEHVLPGQLEATFVEWERVLMPGGSLNLHTPNGNSIAAALVRHETFWPAQGAIFGYGRSPSAYSRPEGLGDSPDHRIVFTFEILRDLLESNGFESVLDVSGEDPCHHLTGWAPFIENLCLEITARKPRLRP